MLVVAISLSLAQFDGETLVDPKDYVSPFGAYVLHVEPSARDGAGPGEYRMLRAGELVWSARLPFTLFEAAVTDSGATVGYAYDGGVRFPAGHFREVALAPDGRILLDAATERVPCRYVVCPPPAEPRALGLVVDEENDRFVVRIKDEDWERGMELWRVYRISSGEKLAEFRPQEGLPEERGVDATIWDVRPLRGSDLFLLHGIDWRYKPRRSDAFFALVELDGDVVWQLQLPHDYEIEGDGDAQFAFNASVREKGAIVDIPAERTFDLWFVREEQRVRFQTSMALSDRCEWRTTELSRRPWTASDQGTAEASRAPSASEDRPAPERVELRSLGTVALERGSRPAPVIRDVQAWTFSEREGFQFVRSDEPGFSIVEIDGDGRQLREVSLEPSPDDEASLLHWTWTSPETCFISSMPIGRGGAARAYRADVRSGVVEEIEGFWSLPATRLVPTSDGALLASVDGAYSPLFVPHATVTTDGRVIAVRTLRKDLQEFTVHGQLLRTIELEQVLGREPEYPCKVSAGPDGSVLLFDSASDPPLWHIDVNGLLLRGITPRFADGRRADARSARFSADGELWTFDGFSFQELDENGIVRRVVGEELVPDAIFQVGAHALDELGRPCLQDFRTGAVHVWSPDGRKLFTGQIDPAAAQDLDRGGWIRAGPDGSVYVSRGVADVRLTHWSPSGEFVGELEPGGNRFVFDRNGRRWGWQYRKGLRLLDENDSVLAAVDHAPDGSWIRQIGDIAVGTDGTLVVLDQPFDHPKVLLYSALGEPLQTFELPALDVSHGPLADISLSGAWIAVSAKDATTVLLRRADGASFLFDPELPDPERGCALDVALSPTGSELWLFATPELTLRRYALP